MSALYGQTAAITALVDAGAKLDAVNNDGFTPLHAAAALGQTKAIITLLDVGANLEAADNDGFTPIDLARKRYHYEVVELLQAAE